MSPEHTTQTMTNTDVSVIIPSFKSTPHVRQCLDALKAQVTTCSHEVILKIAHKIAAETILVSLDKADIFSHPVVLSRR